MVFSFDDSNRMAALTSALSKSGQNTFSSSEQFAYDERGSLTTLTVEGEGQLRYGYDSAGNLVSALDTRANASFSFKYDRDERLSETTAPGLKTTRDYFDNGLTKTITSKRLDTGQTLGYFQYGYDRSNMPAAREAYIQGNPGSGTYSYSYDQVGRLIAADPAAGSGLENIAYAYDSAGNMISKTEGASNTNYYYDTMDRLKSDSSGRTYEYDNAGRLTSVAGGSSQQTSYTYDSEGHLTVGIVGQTTVNYSYDAVGRAVARSQGEETEFFTMRGTGDQPVSITNSTSSTSYLFTPDGSVPLCYFNSESGYRTLGTDIHSDVVFEAESTGSISASTMYRPYGEKQSVSGNPCALGYQGDYTDPVTGLFDMGVRNYDPAAGRFTTCDPKQPETLDPMSYDPYLYANDGPLARIDPDGTSAIGDFFYDIFVQPFVWIYDHIIQPCASALRDVVVNAGQMAKAAAANAVRQTVRIAKIIGAKIGRAMGYVAKQAVRAVSRVSRAIVVAGAAVGRAVAKGIDKLGAGVIAVSKCISSLADQAVKGVKQFIGNKAKAFAWLGKQIWKYRHEILLGIAIVGSLLATGGLLGASFPAIAGILAPVFGSVKSALMIGTIVSLVAGGLENTISTIEESKKRTPEDVDSRMLARTTLSLFEWVPFIGPVVSVGMYVESKMDTE